MALALNNLKRVDMPLNKETKLNHSDFFLEFAAPKFNLILAFVQLLIDS